MPELTTRDWLNLIALAILVIGGIRFVILDQRQREEAKAAFIGHMIGKIQVEDVSKRPFNFPTRSDALKYVTTKVYESRLQYASRNGNRFASNLPKTCERLLDELCRRKIIPVTVYQSWH